MNEKILEILNDYHVDWEKQLGIAEEITSHVMEFIEWLTQDEEADVLYLGNGIYSFYNNITRIEDTTLDKLYQYWLNNVKK